MKKYFFIRSILIPLRSLSRKIACISLIFRETVQPSESIQCNYANVSNDFHSFLNHRLSRRHGAGCRAAERTTTASDASLTIVPTAANANHRGHADTLADADGDSEHIPGGGERVPDADGNRRHHGAAPGQRIAHTHVHAPVNY